MAYEIRLQVMSPDVGVQKAPGEFPPSMGANPSATGRTPPGMSAPPPPSPSVAKRLE